MWLFAILPRRRREQKLCEAGWQSQEKTWSRGKAAGLPSSLRKHVGNTHIHGLGLKPGTSGLPSPCCQQILARSNSPKRRSNVSCSAELCTADPDGNIHCPPWRFVTKSPKLLAIQTCLSWWMQFPTCQPMTLQLSVPSCPLPVCELTHFVCSLLLKQSLSYKLLGFLMRLISSYWLIILSYFFLPSWTLFLSLSVCVLSELHLSRASWSAKCG